MRGGKSHLRGFDEHERASWLRIGSAHLEWCMGGTSCAPSGAPKATNPAAAGSGNGEESAVWAFFNQNIGYIQYSDRTPCHSRTLPMSWVLIYHVTSQSSGSSFHTKIQPSVHLPPSASGQAQPQQTAKQALQGKRPSNRNLRPCPTASAHMSTSPPRMSPHPSGRAV